MQVTSLPDMCLELLNLRLERGVTVHWELKFIAGLVLQKIESFEAGLLEILQADQKNLSSSLRFEKLFRHYDLPAKDLSELISPL